MNLHDSEIVAGQLARLGYELVDAPDSADAVFVNTCTVREHAKLRGLARLRELSGLKRRRPEVFVAAMGCVASEERTRLFETLPFLDAVIPTDQVTQVSRFLSEQRADFGPSEALTAETPRLRFSSFKACVTIITGCNMDCTYCIVPRTRGREKSRPLPDVLREVDSLVLAGYREILFLGQTVNAYGDDLGPMPADSWFTELLRETDRRFSGGRVRFLSPHPGKLTDDLISAWPDLGSLCEHIHLPVQSGSDRILRRMKRFYTRESFLRKVGALRRAMPDIAITTDVIVGFPGETEEDFRQTLSLCEEVGFDAAYMYLYSPRSGTAATRLKDPSPPHDVAVDRHASLAEVQSAHTRASLARQVGRVVEVLFEGPAREGGLFGKSRAFHTVVADLPLTEVGRVVPVRVERVAGTSLRASIPSAVPSCAA
ncbi:tRNA (N6-isopentenyl adenosine(37)-C2)-methylthiotransferase MiaB [bacterium]|nr:tRNA (N6-isopentenyl adenosine(37)-C2)-methylthiotransferase MiaB [bacterium]